MKRVHYFFVPGLFLFALMGSSSSSEKPSIWIAEIRGSINPAVAAHLEETIKKAVENRAQAVLVELDTPGGLLNTTRSIAQMIDQSPIPIIVYVTPAGASATSAGALIMMASHVAAMAPGTNVGAAHPVGPQGKEAEGAMGEKVLNDTKAFARGLADLRKRNVKLAEEVVAKSQSFTAKEAVKGGLIEIVADSRSALLSSLHGRKVRLHQKTVTLHTEGIQIQTQEMSLGQKILNFLANPNIATILMSLGMLLIYVELSNPGIQIAGITGAICLLVAFMAYQLMPIHTGGMLLIALGMILMIAEPFVGSGGILAGGGLVSFIMGLIWVVDSSQTDLVVVPEVWVPVALGLGSGVGIIGWAAGRTRRLAQKALAQMGGGGLSGLQGYSGTVKSVREGGKKGKAEFRGELWDFHSKDTLRAGDEVSVERVKGFRVFVKRKES